jgi:hypothetical protein
LWRLLRRAVEGEGTQVEVAYPGNGKEDKEAAYVEVGREGEGEA